MNKTPNDNNEKKSTGESIAKDELRHEDREVRKDEEVLRKGKRAIKKN